MYQAGLTDARFASPHHQPAPARHGVIQRRLKIVQFALAADEYLLRLIYQTSKQPASKATDGILHAKLFGQKVIWFWRFRLCGGAVLKLNLKIREKEKGSSAEEPFLLRRWNL